MNTLMTGDVVELKGSWMIVDKSPGNCQISNGFSVLNVSPDHIQRLATSADASHKTSLREDLGKIWNQMVDTKNLSSQPIVNIKEPEVIFLPVDSDEGTFSSERNEYWCREFREALSPTDVVQSKSEMKRRNALAGRPMDEGIAETDERQQLNSALAQLTQASKDMRSLEKERDAYRAALEKIAGQDFRGNRPHECVIAYEALQFQYAESRDEKR